MSDSDFEEIPKDNIFHACYLLRTANKKIRNKTYIGYCVDPVRRLKQHNSGLIFGGAKKTNFRGPWEMIVIVFGFPTKRIGLKFEWGWQHAKELKIADMPEVKSSPINQIHALVEMLNSKPWQRIGVHVRFLNDEIFDIFQSLNRTIPKHIEISSGSFDEIFKHIKRVSTKSLICYHCNRDVMKKRIACSTENCQKSYHVLCAYDICQTLEINLNAIMPIYFLCSACNTQHLWTRAILTSF